MVSIGVANLGMVDIGTAQLGTTARRTTHSQQHGAQPIHIQILSKMPAELKQSLVCWYSPNLQGLTNAELFNSNNEYVGGLHDLSGNGHDMTLHGFDGIEGGGHVDEEGNLVFDGLNDWGQTGDIQALTDYTLVCKRKHGDYVSRNVFACKGDNTETTSAFATEKWIGDGLFYVRTFGNQSNVSAYYDADMFVQTKYRYNGNDLLQGSYVDTISPLYFAKINSYQYSNLTLHSAILFDRTLTDTELDWVKTNMLVSQEPSKRNVTLWLVDEESGTFDKLKTLKVQNGNMIGKYDEDDNLVLPIYDIDAIHQTSLQWYTDVECTEEYFGEYITEDTFLYAKKVKTSDNMLAQLDNVVLQDGTTAREHLVCWYSPKLQGLTKESVLADATLTDLSGNGYDMVFEGFTNDEEIISTDGSLVFDGVNDAAYSDLSKNWQAFTCIAEVSNYIAQGSPHGCLIGLNSTSNTGILYWRFMPTSNTLKFNTSYKEFASNGINIINGSSSSVMKSKGISFSRPRSGVNYYNHFGLLTSMLFDVELSETEIEKVKTILKLQ